MLGSVTGRGIERNIADCYAFIINHYEPGDRIFLFGFSRGAYTVRSLANLLMLCGVPTKTPSGPLMRFRKQVRDIAKEAVTVVWNTAPAIRAPSIAAEREEQARRFQVKYGSDGNVNSNVAPYFIGVFDTVAALEQRARLRSGSGRASHRRSAATAVATALPTASIAGILHWLTGWDLWAAWGTLWLLIVIGLGGWWVREQKKAQLKVIKDFPKQGDVRKHDAEWKGDNFDRLLSVYVRYGRAANAIDENRKDFQRVGWGSAANDVTPTDGGPPKLSRCGLPATTRHRRQLSGGGVEAVGQRAIVDAGTGDLDSERNKGRSGLRDRCEDAERREAGTPLNIYPRPDGVQHCELAGMRDTMN